LTKIAIIVFDMESAGGQINLVKHLKIAFDRVGIETEPFLFRKKGKNTFDKKWGAKCLYFGDERYNELKSEMERFDVGLFIAPVPHISKANKGEDLSWTKCFDISPRIFAFIPDSYWEKYYPWMTEVMNKIEYYIPDHPISWASMLNFPDPNLKKKMKMIYYPVDTQDASKDNKWDDSLKEDKVISTNWFKPWKHMFDLIKTIPDINYPVEVCSIGIEYWYLKNPEKKPKYYKNPDTKETWWQYALDNGMEYLGWVKREKVLEMYKTGRIMIDLSQSKWWDWGNITRTICECMVYGVVPVIRPEGTGVIDEKNAVIAHPDDNLADIVNKVMKDYDRQREICEYNFKFVKKWFESETIGNLWKDLIEGRFKQFHPLPPNEDWEEWKRKLKEKYYPSNQLSLDMWLDD